MSPGAITCPKCEAQPGAPCVKLVTGMPLARMHPERRAAADLADPPPMTVRLSPIQLRLTAESLGTHSRLLARKARAAGAKTSAGIMAESILAAHMSRELAKLLRRS